MMTNEMTASAMTASEMTATPVTRARALDIARAWLGTPYHHQASTLGAGTDCIGLVRGVFRTLYGREPEALPGYSRDWAEASGDETLIAAARRHLIEIDPLTVGPADILVFRFRPNMVAKHTGILGCTPFSLSPFSALERGESWPRTLDPGEGRRQTRTTNLFVIPAKAGTQSPLGELCSANCRAVSGSRVEDARFQHAYAPSRGACPPNPLLSIRQAPRSRPDTPDLPSLTLIHALEGAAVAEVPFADWWRRRIAAAFSFPGITD